MYFRLSLAILCSCIFCAWSIPIAFADPASVSLFEVVHLLPQNNAPTITSDKFVWYYRTEVRNNSKRPLKIVWFEGYNKYQDNWYGGNILGKILRGEEFTKWYSEGVKVDHGVIPPGTTAVCDPNWQVSNERKFEPSKWAFIAVDDQGNDYFSEAIVGQDVVKLRIRDKTTQ